MSRFRLKLLLLLVVLGCSAEAEEARQKLLRSPGTTRPAINYWWYTPVTPHQQGSSSERSERTRPLVLFLHGGGEGGATPELVKKHGPPMMIDQGHHFPGFVASPQNPSRSQYWDDHQLIELIDHLVSTQPIDTSRIYVVGMSRGCFGGWRLLIQNPNRFAAFVGVCGGGPAPYAGRVKDVPVRLFHGASDPVIPVEESIRMRDAHVDVGGDCVLTIYPETQHDAWSKAFADEQMWAWLFQQRNDH